MGDNPLLTILQNIVQFIQGDTGKILCLLVILAGGICWWFNIGDKKKWALGAIIGTVCVFSGTWIAQHFLGIQVNA